MRYRPEEHRPPQLMLQLFRWFCREEYQEEIEGDLLEQFHTRLEKEGLSQARWQFIGDVFHLLRPELMGYPFHFNHLPMRTSTWRNLILLNAIAVILLLLRFMPGPSNQLVVDLSTICFTTMTLGLLISPVNLAWVLVEIKQQRQPHAPADLWHSGYRFAALVLIISSLFLVLALFFSWMAKAYFIWPSIALLACLIALGWPKLKTLRQTTPRSLNPAPFLMLSVPVVILFVHAYLVVPVNNYSRTYAIKRTAPLISAIENYKAQEGQYPPQLQDLLPRYLRRLPQPNIMGSRDFQYQRTADAYTLSFKINLGETDEWVLYHPKEQYAVKGHYADFKPKEPHWRCFWMD